MVRDRSSNQPSDQTLSPRERPVFPVRHVDVPSAAGTSTGSESPPCIFDINSSWCVSYNTCTSKRYANELRDWPQSVLPSGPARSLVTW